MNKLIAQKDTLIDLTHKLRNEILNAIVDADLDKTLGGATLSLRALLLEQAGFQRAYTELFKTFALRFENTVADEHIGLEAIKTKFDALDAEMIAALGALSNEDLARRVDRGSHKIPLEVTFFTYRESVFIFAAKASVYLRALGYALPPQVASFVA
jgi:uncharacterized damage-inducible protein DinB